MDSVPYRFKTEPYQHQLTAFHLSKDETEFGLFMEMGTGKSKVTIDKAAYLYDNGAIDLFLIVAPKGAYRDWDKLQIPKHMPDHVMYDVAHWSSVQSSEVKRRLKKLPERNGNLKVLVVNVEALSMKKSKALDYVIDMMRSHRTFMVVDESTTIKNHKANRSKNVYKLGRWAKYKQILSGQPITRSPLDIFGQCNFLGTGLLGESSYYSFRNRFAVTEKVKLHNRPEFTRVVGYQRMDELQKLVRGFSYRVTKAECLDLPKKLPPVVREVEMTDEQKDMYKRMAKTAIAEFEGNLITAPIAITKLLKLHQIVCGVMKTEEGDWLDIKNNRINALMDVIEEADDKIVIWANYKRNIEQIVDALNKNYGAGSAVHYYGGTSDEERERAKEEFQNGDVRFFVGNPQTGKYSLTLTSSHDCIYFSNNYDLDARGQSEDRVHRIGQESPVNYVDLCCPGTIDQTIIDCLRDKRDMADLFVDGDARSLIERFEDIINP